MRSELLIVFVMLRLVVGVCFPSSLSSDSSWNVHNRTPYFFLRNGSSRATSRSIRFLTKSWNTESSVDSSRFISCLSRCDRFTSFNASKLCEASNVNTYSNAVKHRLALRYDRYSLVVVVDSVDSADVDAVCVRLRCSLVEVFGASPNSI